MFVSPAVITVLLTAVVLHLDIETYAVRLTTPTGDVETSWVLCSEYKQYRLQLPRGHGPNQNFRCANGGTCMIRVGPPNILRDEAIKLGKKGKIGTTACKCSRFYTGLNCGQTITDLQDNPFEKLPDGKTGKSTLAKCESKCKKGYCTKAVTKTVEQGLAIFGKKEKLEERTVYFCDCYTKVESSNVIKDEWCTSTCHRMTDCLNGGRCVPVRQPSSHFECKCSGAWTGEKCDTSLSCFVDIVHKKPSVFKKIANKFSRKKNKKKEDAVDLCRNGGFCKRTNDKSICVCPAHYTGYRCESLLPGKADPNSAEFNCNSKKNRCKHGKCVKKGIRKFYCECRKGWRGNRCHLKCEPYTFGEDCLEDCKDRHCLNDKPCDRKTGLCKKCAQFWINSEESNKKTCDRIDHVAVTSEMILSGEFQVELSNETSNLSKIEKENIEHHFGGPIVTEVVAKSGSGFKKKFLSSIQRILSSDKSLKSSKGEVYNKEQLTIEKENVESSGKDFSLATNDGIRLALASNEIRLQTLFKHGSVVVTMETVLPAAMSANLDVQGTMEKILKDNADKYNSTLGPGYRIDKNSITVSKPQRVGPGVESSPTQFLFRTIAVASAGISMIMLVVMIVYLIRNKMKRSKRSWAGYPGVNSPSAEFEGVQGKMKRSWAGYPGVNTVHQLSSKVSRVKPRISGIRTVNSKSTRA